MKPLIFLFQFNNKLKDGGLENYKRNVMPRSVKSMRNAFSNDINACLFNDWVNKGIISSQIICNCPNHGLCYGPIDRQALFISCYNSDTRIPAFTAHVVQASAVKTKKSKNRPNWKKDTGTYGVCIIVLLWNNAYVEY